MRRRSRAAQTSILLAKELVLGVQEIIPGQKEFILHGQKLIETVIGALLVARRFIAGAKQLIAAEEKRILIA